MNNHFLFKIILSLIFSSFLISEVSLSQSSDDWKNIRNFYAFDKDIKWDCFYRTTMPVNGLNPALWRQDQFGNLLMAGLNFNCEGCLCYTFDHRFPISNIGLTKANSEIQTLMSSIHNCQALSFRTNALKGSNNDQDIKSIVRKFGCDRKTMNLFEGNNYLGARAVQKYLLNQDRIDQFHGFYKNYIVGENFLDPSKVDSSKTLYFKYLDKKAEEISEKISLKLNKT